MGKTAVAADDHCYSMIIAEKHKLEGKLIEQKKKSPHVTMGEALHSLLNKLEELTRKYEGSVEPKEEKIIEASVK